MSLDTNSLSNDCVTHFDNKASNWSALYARASFADRLSQFVSRASELVKVDGHILDYGCGTGVLARALHDVGFKVTGVDASSMMIEEAQKSCGDQTAHDLNFRHINSAEWPDTDESYDAIVCSSVLEYVEDHGVMLSKLSSKIRPGGLLLISVPNSHSLVGRLEDIYSRLSSGWRNRRERDVAYCNRRFSAEEFKDLLDKVDIDTTDIGYFELPKIGRFGIRPSRNKLAGVMMIVSGIKRQ